VLDFQRGGEAARGAHGGAVGAYATLVGLYPTTGPAFAEDFAFARTFIGRGNRPLEGLIYEAAADACSCEHITC